MHTTYNGSAIRKIKLNIIVENGFFVIDNFVRASSERYM